MQSQSQSHRLINNTVLLLIKELNSFSLIAAFAD
jgi:hypothetical protein